MSEQHNLKNYQGQAVYNQNAYNEVPQQVNYNSTSPPTQIPPPSHYDNLPPPHNPNAIQPPQYIPIAIPPPQYIPIAIPPPQYIPIAIPPPQYIPNVIQPQGYPPQGQTVIIIPEDPSNGDDKRNKAYEKYCDKGFCKNAFLFLQAEFF
jgi:hypothetical protein